MNVSVLLAWFAIFTGVCAVHMVAAQNNSLSSPPSTSVPVASSVPSTQIWSTIFYETKTSGNDISSRDVNSQCASSSSPAILTGSGQISSRNYPFNYGSYADCNWRIVSTSTQAVMLTFTSFSTESCCDLVSLYDGYSTSSRRIVQLSGIYYVLPNYYSSQMYMFVTFTTDSSITASGFLASYQQTGASATTTTRSSTTTTRPTTTRQPVNSQCSSIYSPTMLTGNGQISSQNYPQSYLNGADCNWMITADASQVVILTFSAFSTQVGFDNVTLYDGYDASALPIVQLSGYYSTLPSYNSTQSYMLVNFRTDSTVTFSGFIAAYQTSNGNVVSGTKLIWIMFLMIGVMNSFRN